MKIFTLLLPAIVITHLSLAQNIGMGTTTPHASAMLDITSTTKGTLLPRMNSIQRGAIVSPATGLLVFDTDTKTIWTFDGTNWKNLYTSGGLTLPFAQTVNLGISAFQVTNQGTGAAIEGVSSNELGTAITAKATGDFGRGLFAYTDKPGGNSIYAIADNGKVFHGENSNPGNTNTLMSLINRGVAKTATFQLANTSSNDGNVQIAGNNLGEQLLIFQTNAANTKAAISVTNSGTGAGVSSVANNGTGVTGTSTAGAGIIGTSTSNIGVSGISSTNYGLKGSTNSSGGFAGVHGQNTGTAGSGVVGVSDLINTQGVYGTSANGIGVRANSGNYRAVQATTTSGTALFGSSTSGYSLDISGNVKIAGGNTNPSAGAILTSIDVSGNAVWKQPNKVAFRATGIYSGLNVIPDFTTRKLHFPSEQYDYANSFELTSSTSPTTDMSNFVAPVTGLYHFEAALSLQLSDLDDDFEGGYVSIIIKRGANFITVARGHTPCCEPQGFGLSLFVSTDCRLLIGDDVYVELNQSNDAAVGATISNNSFETYFCGRLILAD